MLPFRCYKLSLLRNRKSISAIHRPLQSVRVYTLLLGHSGNTALCTLNWNCAMWPSGPPNCGRFRAESMCGYHSISSANWSTCTKLHSVNVLRVGTVHIDHPAFLAQYLVHHRSSENTERTEVTKEQDHIFSSLNPVSSRALFQAKTRPAWEHLAFPLLSKRNYNHHMLTKQNSPHCFWASAVSPLFLLSVPIPESKIVPWDHPLPRDSFPVIQSPSIKAKLCARAHTS